MKLKETRLNAKKLSFRDKFTKSTPQPVQEQPVFQGEESVEVKDAIAAVPVPSETR